MAISRSQITIINVNDGKTPIKGEDYVDGAYITAVAQEYFLSTDTTKLLPTTPKIITFDDGTTITIGQWVTLKEGDTLPIAKGFVSGKKELYIIFRHERYTWSDGRPDTYSVASHHESDQRIVEWCSASDKTFFDGSKIYAGSVHAAQIAADAITAEKLSTDAITSRNYYKKDAEGKDTTEPSGYGSKLDLATGAWDSLNFQVTKEGKICATEADISGKITAESGQIANFNIVGNRLTSGNGDGFVNLQSAKYPQDYVLAEYIESSGTQYIDTGVCSANNITIEVDAQTFDTRSAYGSTNGYNYTTGSQGTYFYYFQETTGTGQGGLSSNKGVRETIKQEDNICYRNGSVAHTFTQIPGLLDTYPIFLFGRNSKGALNDSGQTRIYSCKIWRDGKLIRNFVPVYRNNEFCMYETCYGQYYTNKGTGVFNGVLNKDTKNTFIEQDGSSYQVLDYIESSGTQYIDTGVSGNNDNLKIEAKYAMLDFANYAGVFGNYSGEGYNCWRLLLTNVDNNSYYTTTNRKAGGSDSVTIQKGVINNVTLSKDKIVINNIATALTNVTNATTNDSTIVLFTQAPTSTCAKMRLYEFRIYDNGSLVRNYVPVLKDNATYGLYDLKNRVFYGNNGTGAFTGAELTDEFSAIYLGAPTPEDAPFSVTNTGKLKAESGTIAGWTIDSNKLTSGTIGEDGSFGVFPKGIIGGLNSEADKALASGDAWVMTAGSKFGVTKNGALYATNANISGTITAESGKIAGWEIQNDPNKGKIPAIFYGAFGSPESFHMYAGDKEGTLHRIDLNGNDIFRVWKDNWRLTIGSNFGVTSDGEIYAYKGSLAGIDISGDNLTWSNEKGELVSLISGVLRQGTARPVGDSGNKNDWFLWTGGKFGVDAKGYLYATGADISGKIAAKSGSIAGWDITNAMLLGPKEEGKGDASRKVGITSLVTAPGFAFWAGQQTGDGKNNAYGYDAPFRVDHAGNLTANSGSIAGWKIDTNHLGTLGTSLGSGGIHLYPNGTADSTDTHFGSSGTKRWMLGIGEYFGVTTDGALYANAGQIGGWEIGEVNPKTSGKVGLFKKFTASDGIGYCTGMMPYGAGGNANIWAGASYNGEGMTPWEIYNALDNAGLDTNAWSNYVPFYVTGNGEVHCSDLDATGGNIGALKIQNGGLQYDINEEKSFSLNSLGLILEKNTAKVQVGDLEMGYDATEKNTIIKTSGHLTIRGANSTQLEFMKKTGGNTISFNVAIYCELAGRANGNNIHYYDVWTEIESETAPLMYPFSLNLGFRLESRNFWGTYEPGDTEWTEPLIIPAGETVSSTYRITAGNGDKVSFLKRDGSWSAGVKPSKDAAKACVHGSYTQDESFDNLYITGNLLPSITSTDLEDGSGNGTGYNLGSGAENGAIWNTVYARNQTIQSSDREVKKDIEPLSDLHEQIFDALEPVSYKFKVSNNNRTHTGFIAQGVKSAVENAGLTTQDFAAYCEWEKEDGTIGCGLRYGEFIALCVNEIQKLKPRMASAEEKLLAYESRISALEKEIENLKKS